MSKMSQLNATLEEQASQLGFRSIEEAESNGYVIDYKDGVLVDGREEAHKDYEKRKENLLLELTIMRQHYLERGKQDKVEILTKTIEMIKEKEV